MSSSNSARRKYVHSYIANCIHVLISRNINTHTDIQWQHMLHKFEHNQNNEIRHLVHVPPLILSLSYCLYHSTLFLSDKLPFSLSLIHDHMVRWESQATVSNFLSSVSGGFNQKRLKQEMYARCCVSSPTEGSRWQILCYAKLLYFVEPK